MTGQGLSIPGKLLPQSIPEMTISAPIILWVTLEKLCPVIDHEPCSVPEVVGVLGVSQQGTHVGGKSESALFIAIEDFEVIGSLAPKPDIWFMQTKFSR